MFHFVSFSSFYLIDFHVLLLELKEFQLTYSKLEAKDGGQRRNSSSRMGRNRSGLQTIWPSKLRWMSFELNSPMHKNELSRMKVPMMLSKECLTREKWSLTTTAISESPRESQADPSRLSPVECRTSSILLCLNACHNY